eukprot:2967446-Heterocapsa_arctica.AAC.1
MRDASRHLRVAAQPKNQLTAQFLQKISSEYPLSCTDADRVVLVFVRTRALSHPCQGLRDEAHQEPFKHRDCARCPSPCCRTRCPVGVDVQMDSRIVEPQAEPPAFGLLH